MINNKKIIIISIITFLILYFKYDYLKTSYVLDKFSYNSNGPYQKIEFFEKIYNFLDEKYSMDWGINKINFLENIESEKQTAKFKSLSKNNLDFGISYFNAITRFKKNNLDLPSPIDNFELKSDQNDWQSFQILIVPFVNNIKDIKIQMPKLNNIHYKVEAFVGEYVFCPKPAYKNEGKDWYVDPLIPLMFDSTENSYIFHDENYKFRTKLNENKSIWFNIYVPEKTNPGQYKIPISIELNNQIKNSNLNLEVSKKVLSRKKKFNDLFGFQEDHLITWNNYDTTLIQGKRKMYYDFLLKYNINPVNLYEKKTWPPVEDWDYCIKKGANVINFTYLMQWENDSLNYSNLRKEIQKSKKNQFKNSRYIYLCDEITKKDILNLNNKILYYESLLKNFKLIYTTAEKILDSDIVKHSQIEKISNFKLKDKSSWTYICNTSNSPEYNLFTDTPIDEILKLGTQLKSKKKLGFLYYGINEWKHNLPKDTIFYQEVDKLSKWPYKKWNTFTYKNYNGDGQLVYPGFNGDLWPSVRLIQVREMLTFLNN